MAIPATTTIITQPTVHIRVVIHQAAPTIMDTIHTTHRINTIIITMDITAIMDTTDITNTTNTTIDTATPATATIMDTIQIANESSACHITKDTHNNTTPMGTSIEM